MGGTMAGFTILFRIIFRINKILMDIVMTINAVRTNGFKFPFLGLFMTLETRGCHMGSFQWKYPLIVLFQGIGEFVKSFNRMAPGAVRRFPVFNKLLAVIVGMAIGTLAVWQRGGEFLFMARFAGHLLMFPLKLKIGFIVVEAGWASGYFK
jgi:hypothetical protein